MEDLVLGEYRIEKALGKGAFGQVVCGISAVSGERVAIKLEEKVQGKPRFLVGESQVLASLQGGAGIPRLYRSGKHRDTQCLVMELLGPNLSVLFKQQDKRMPLKSVLEIATQGIDRIRHVHQRFYMHRDIKPQNFMFGLQDKQNVLYIADFGLAKKYQNGPRGQHIPYKEDKSFVGTACYASLNTHLGIQQSRRDDLESLMYILCFLLKGKLPWQKKFKTKSEKHNTTRVQKMLISTEELFSGCSRGFAAAFTYVRGISFDDEPEYDRLKSIFTAMAAEIETDFDWINTQQGRKSRKDRTRIRTIQGNEQLLRTDDGLSRTRPATIDDMPGRRRSASPPSSFTPAKVSLGVLPAIPCPESSENSSYEGWQEEAQDEKDGDDTVKETKGPTINRSVLPAKE